LKATAKAEHGVVLAREQCVHAEPRFRGEFLEAAALQLMCHKDVALFLWQLVQGGIELVEQDTTGVRRVRTRIRRRKQIFEQQLRVLTALDRGFHGYGRLSLAVQVRDTVSSDAKQPRARVLNRPNQPHGLDEFAKHVLQDVFCVINVPNACADERPETTLLALNRVGQSLVLACHVEGERPLVHLLL
jgi:hypothetical protein